MFFLFWVAIYYYNFANVNLAIEKQSLNSANKPSTLSSYNESKTVRDGAEVPLKEVKLSPKAVIMMQT